MGYKERLTNEMDKVNEAAMILESVWYDPLSYHESSCVNKHFLELKILSLEMGRRIIEIENIQQSHKKEGE